MRSKTPPPGRAGASRAEERTDPDVVAGRRPVVELLRSGRAIQRVLVDQDLPRRGIIGDVVSLAESAGAPVRFVPRSAVEKAAPGLNHQGVAAVTNPFRYASLKRILEAGAPVLMLDGVTDPHNVGSLLRSAACAGFGGVVIPAHRAAPVTATVRRVSAGASESIPVARVPNLIPALEAARSAGMWCVGLDPAATEDLWTSRLLDPPVVLVLGSEGKGLRPGVRKGLDGVVAIPQTTAPASLNVAAAGAVAMFEVSRRSQGVR